MSRTHRRDELHHPKQYGCPHCQVYVNSLNCPRCGRLTEKMKLAAPIRRAQFDKYMPPMHVLVTETKGTQSRRKTRIQFGEEE